MGLDPKVWGPHYWFVLHTIALTYPIHPSNTIKKRYYDFIHNLPIFLPISNIANHFSSLLDDFPVTPYLDSRESFFKWIYFIHNKINVKLNIPEITLEEAFTNYHKNYKPRTFINKELLKTKQLYIYFAIILCIIVTIIYLYKC